jgi:membrane-bound metal-dependent hydrolase YbcI (DUF457 family)
MSRLFGRSAVGQSCAPSRGRLFVTAGLLSLLPDVDSVLGLVMGDFGRYHNNLTHSLSVALMVALAIGAVAGRGGRERFAFWFGLAFACYGLHIVMDYLTWGRGVMALWPMRPDRFSSPLVLFYGFHWSQGWVSPQHLWTLLTEAPVAAAAVLTAHRLTPVRARG